MLAVQSKKENAILIDIEKYLNDVSSKKILDFKIKKI